MLRSRLLVMSASAEDAVIFLFAAFVAIAVLGTFIEVTPTAPANASAIPADASRSTR